MPANAVANACKTIMSAIAAAIIKMTANTAANGRKSYI